MAVTVAPSARALVASLFTPGGTHSGCVTRRGVRFVELQMGPARFRVNKWGVWSRIEPDGRLGFLWGDEDDAPSRSDQREIARGLAVSTEIVRFRDGIEILHRFK